MQKFLCLCLLFFCFLGVQTAIAHSVKQSHHGWLDLLVIEPENDAPERFQPILRIIDERATTEARKTGRIGQNKFIFTEQWLYLAVAPNSDQKLTNFNTYHDKEVTIYGYGDGLANDTQPFFVEYLKVHSKFEQKRSIESSGLIIPPLKTLGSRSVLILLVNFSNSQIQPYSQATIREWAFDGTSSVQKYYRDMTKQKIKTDGINKPKDLSFTGLQNSNGDVTPWITIPSPVPSPEDCQNFLMNNGRIEANAGAAAAGYTGQYDIRVYVYLAPNGANCSIAQGTIGEYGTVFETEYTFISVGESGSQAELYNSVAPTLRHELMHNLGQAGHSGCQEYAGNSGGTQNDLGDVLGGSRGYAHIINRIRFGWTDKENLSPPLQNQGTYELELYSPAEQQAGTGAYHKSVSAYIILRDLNGNLDNKALFIERRTNSGWDQFGTTYPYYTMGVSMRIVSINLSNYVEGTTMITPQPIPQGICSSMSPLRPNILWSNNSYGVTVLVGNETRGGGLRVTVNLGSNYPANSFSNKETAF